MLDLATAPEGIEERGDKLWESLGVVDPQANQVRGEGPVTFEIEDFAFANQFSGAVRAIEEDVALFQSVCQEFLGCERKVLEVR